MIMKFPVYETITTTTTTTTITTTTTTTKTTKRTTIDIYNDNSIWDDPDLDLAPIDSVIKPTRTSISTTTKMIISESTTTMKQQTTSIGQYSNESLLEPFIQESDEHDWIILNSSSLPSVTQVEPLLFEDDDSGIEENDFEDSNEHSDDLFFTSTSLNPNINLDINDYNPSQIMKPTSIINDSTITNNTQLLFPLNIHNETDDSLSEYIELLPKFPLPPFSWMINMFNENQSHILNSTETDVSEDIELLPETTLELDVLSEFCKNKRCYHGGRLNSDCLCLCLPAFTGDNCETGNNRFF